MATSQDELFVDTLRDQIVNVLMHYTEFLVEVDNGCRRGCCPREYNHVSDLEATEVADTVIVNVFKELKLT